jgi:hypothetical protein
MTLAARLSVVELRYRPRVAPPQLDRDIDPTGALSALSDDDLLAIRERRPLSPAATQAIAAWERDQSHRHSSQSEDRDGGYL